MQNRTQPPPDRINYTVKNNGQYFTTGIDGQGRQVLIGLLFGATSLEVFGVLFDQSGNYLGSIVERVTPLSNEDDDASATRTLADVRRKIDLNPSSIYINKFWIEDRQVGIADLPEHYQDFLNNPNELDEQRRAELSGDVQRWFAEGDFVLWWGEDYYLDKDGDVSSS